MKEYDVRYDLDQEVYILTNKFIYKGRVEKIRITQSRPWKNGDDNLKQMSGIVIEYLVVIEEVTRPGCKGTSISYDWYNQDDVFSDKEELIRKIK